MRERTRFDISALPAEARRQIRATRRRLNFAVAAAHACRAVAAVLMGAGVSVLTAKLLARNLLAEPGAPLAAGTFTAAAIYLLLRRMSPGRRGAVRPGTPPWKRGGTVDERPFEDRDAAVLYDLAVSGGGLALAVAERPSAAHAARVPSPPVAPVRLRPPEFARPLLVPALFLAGSLVVPGRTPPELRRDHAFRRATRGASETAEALADAEILLPETLESVRRQLDEIQTEPSSERSWEALDAVEERIALEVEEAADALAWTMQATDALAEAPADESRRAELAAALARLEKTGVLGELPPELAPAGAAEGRLPSDPEALRRTLRALSAHLEKRAGESCRSSSRCKGARAQQALDDLAAYVDERLRTKPCEGSIYLTPEREAALYGGELPGRGGISRGPGEAPMVWGAPVDSAGADFKPKELPPGFADSGSAETLAVLTAAPPEAGETERSTATGAAAREDVGEPAGAVRLSPARREVVRRYFSPEGTRVRPVDDATQ